MMIRTLPNHTRLHELLADRALHGLSEGEHSELLAVAAECGLSPEEIEYTEYDLAAGCYDLLVAQPHPMPTEVKQRLLTAANQGVPRSLAITEARQGATRIGDGRGGRGGGAAMFAWLAAAACLALAAVAWWPKVVGSPGSGVLAASVRPKLVEQFIKQSPDAVRVAWGDWAAEGDGPEIPGVKGEVIWSDAQQKGFMHFTGLPANDRTKDQYQLWIIDGSRGMQQRISGGVFNGEPGTVDIYLPIQPGLRVNKAAAFAVTIEQPGGTWVSDMTRRVVIASIKG